MAEKLDKNLAIERYSWPGGNRMDLLAVYCAQAGCSGEARVLATEIEELQGAIWAKILRISGPYGLSRSRLRRIVRTHLTKNIRWVDELGFLGLIRWAESMAEGASILVDER